MPPLVEIPLETYLLAQQATPIECLVCGQENCQSSERCRHCSAPMVLAHQARRVKQTPQFVAVLGAAGSGKTVYLGMLMDMLTRQVGSLRSTARGPSSITLQQMTATALADGAFPDKTDRDPDQWQWVHCQFQCERRRRPLELILPDISGDALAEETERSGKYPAIRSMLAKCAGVIVLLDAEQLRAGDHSQEFITMKMLSLMEEVREKRKSLLSRFYEQRPLALVLTKADACEDCFEDPHQFAQAHAGTLLNDCEARFPRHSVFACSVAGACGYRDSYGVRHSVPLRIEPQGIVQPFGWLITELP